MQKLICALKSCKNKFTPKSERHIYCSRSCFKRANYYKKREEEGKNKKFPIFLCPNCHQMTELTFDIIKYEEKFYMFTCPHCRTLFINISECLVAQDIPKT